MQDGRSCRDGCNIYGDLRALSQSELHNFVRCMGALLWLLCSSTANPPQSPAEPPMLLDRREDAAAGIFDILYSVPERNATFVNVTAFIFRVENDMSTRYVFQVFSFSCPGPPLGTPKFVFSWSWYRQAWKIPWIWDTSLVRESTCPLQLWIDMGHQNTHHFLQFNVCMEVSEQLYE